MTQYKALEIRESEDRQFTRHIVEKSTDDLTQGEVLIKVHYSSLNFKDALSATGNKGVTRNYPHTPGIDAAGTVVESQVSDILVDEKVVVTGYDLGMNTSGGYGQYIRVPAGWLVSLPSDLTLQQSMVYGTAGFTAALCVYKLVNHGVTPDRGKVLVTGATGGVGTIATAILAKLGYDVSASTGKTEEAAYLEELGAKEIISRTDLIDTTGKPMLKSRWAGVVDTVGGDTLSTVIREANYDGVVTACGNVGGIDFKSNVFPFILKGVSLLGVDSVQCSKETRLEIWNKLARDWNVLSKTGLSQECPLEELSDYIDQILQGKFKGRLVVNLGH